MLHFEAVLGEQRADPAEQHEQDGADASEPSVADPDRGGDRGNPEDQRHGAQRPLTRPGADKDGAFDRQPAVRSGLTERECAGKVHD